ncbi:MAG: archease [Candidatus Micrarchaeota archaeon]
MYRFLPHTSDLIVQATGSSFEKALEQAAAAMLTQMGAEHATGKEKIELLVKQENRDDLVVAALTAIISECESEHFTPKKAVMTKAEGGVKITLYGEKKQPENIVKAVTYHELKVEQLKGSWRITVLLDI